MKHLCDANFWIALARATHVHHPDARTWLDTLNDGDTLVFCRATQQSFLRLLTTNLLTRQPRLTNREALATYREIRRDSRTEWMDEPAGLEEVWLAYADGPTASPQTWMDAYLAAFAQLSRARLVTFDQGFKVYKGLDWINLSSRK